jgi:hypothetical protein
MSSVGETPADPPQKKRKNKAEKTGTTKKSKKNKKTSEKNGSKRKYDTYPIVFSYNIKSCNELEVKLALRGRNYSQNNGSFAIGESVNLVADILDVYDSNCMKVYDEKGMQCGTVPSEIAFHFAPLIHCELLTVKTSEVVSDTEIKVDFEVQGRSLSWLSEFCAQIPKDVTRSAISKDDKEKERNANLEDNAVAEK